MGELRHRVAAAVMLAIATLSLLARGWKLRN
jgi:hypothetical protein